MMITFDLKKHKGVPLDIHVHTLYTHMQPSVYTDHQVPADGAMTQSVR